MIDKSIRADYAIQGGGPNYLGKQEMVKAPKKWQSSPDHAVSYTHLTLPTKRIV